MSPFGLNAITTGLDRPCASWVCVNPAGRLGLIVVEVLPEALTAAPDSVPVTVAVSGTVVPAAAVICAVIVTVQAWPAGRLGAVQVTLLVVAS